MRGGCAVAAVQVAGQDAAPHGGVLELELAALVVHVLQHAGPDHEVLPRLS